MLYPDRSIACCIFVVSGSSDYLCVCVVSESFDYHLCLCCIRIAFLHVMSLTHPDSPIILIVFAVSGSSGYLYVFVVSEYSGYLCVCVVFRSTDYFVCLSYIRKDRLPLCQMYPG